MNKLNIPNLPSVWMIESQGLAGLKVEYLSYVGGAEEYRAHIDARNLFGSGFIDINKISPTYFMAGVNGEIGVLQISGVITPKTDLFSLLFGGSTIDVMTRDFRALLEDDAVRAILLDIDSPGGVPYGVPEFSGMVYAGRQVKPIYALSSSMMTSAAYYIGAAAEQVFITDEFVHTGSIGVAAQHVDVSEMERKMGLVVTDIVAGDLKRIASIHAPLTPEGRADIQAQIDHIYAAFKADIALFRGVDIGVVSEEMANGKLFVGSQGVEAGLVDDIIGEVELIKRIDEEIADSVSANFN